jgi:hypothetical protein
MLAAGQLEGNPPCCRYNWGLLHRKWTEEWGDVPALKWYLNLNLKLLKKQNVFVA